MSSQTNALENTIPLIFKPFILNQKTMLALVKYLGFPAPSPSPRPCTQFVFTDPDPQVALTGPG